MNGPFLLLNHPKITRVPETVLTKTHCHAVWPKHTTRRFIMGCLSGQKAVMTENSELVLLPVTYDPSLVTKAIHIFRHPLDNIVARFHFAYNKKGNQTFHDLYPNNATGFQRWCESEDKDLRLFQSLSFDDRLTDKMKGIPCRNEFFRYVQWHNTAFSAMRDMALPTMILHYHEYQDDYQGTRDRILAWLGLPLVGEGVPFQTGKRYRHFYTALQKRAILSFVRELASADTWEQLKRYDFG